MIAIIQQNAVAKGDSPAVDNIISNQRLKISDSFIELKIAVVTLPICGPQT